MYIAQLGVASVFHAKATKEGGVSPLSDKEITGSNDYPWFPVLGLDQAMPAFTPVGTIVQAFSQSVSACVPKRFDGALAMKLGATPSSDC